MQEQVQQKQRDETQAREDEQRKEADERKATLFKINSCNTTMTALLKDDLPADSVIKKNRKVVMKEIIDIAEAKAKQ